MNEKRASIIARYLVDYQGECDGVVLREDLGYLRQDRHFAEACDDYSGMSSQNDRVSELYNKLMIERHGKSWMLLKDIIEMSRATWVEAERAIFDEDGK